MALALTAACKPDLGSPPSIVQGPRILAVRGTPAEAALDAPVSYDVLAADVDGPIAGPMLGWATCSERKPPAESNAVGVACLTIPDTTSGATYMANMPTDACKKFGPQPDVDMNKVPIRPTDPDVTGGFYQPVRATLTKDGTTSIAFALERITCPLANAPSDIVGKFNDAFMPNQNPTLVGLTLTSGTSPVALYARTAGSPAPPASTVPATMVTAGTKATLEVAWSSTTPESFLVWNLATQTLEMHREALSVSWYATDGSFEHDRTGRAETETDLTTDNTWTAPLTAGPVHFWIVLRDTRGGIDYAGALLEVSP